MKRFFQAFFVVLSCLATPVYAVDGIDETNPYLLVQQVADKTFTRLKQQQNAIRANPNLLKDVVREELMPYINYKYAAGRILGPQYKKQSKEDIRAFIPAFRDYLITSYAQVFTLYNNQTVDFESEKPIKGRIVQVKTVINDPARGKIDIIFKARLEKKTQTWKAYDMIAEGVSLLDAKQKELNSIIRQKGLAHVTEMLKEKAAQDIVFKEQ
ncbi:ABC transporter substrate-binding protein [Thalassotalea agarivorans]|uniref:Phospholipid transport system substrate-binding protein n=1 Tax=Thalassotalea agarivorans TaxID=349064 RepID=A0A1I0FUH5_THASX|nr:ABC transporter substrate-binding protein [Thalassotalea agarivorans]SET61096.1 phospholipid transport system substrate-binding protein [Thalassotalea agarivorans]